MEIKSFENGDENAIIELFNIVFKRSMSMEYWRWRFENNPAGKHMLSLMWDQGKLVGHYAVSPVRLRINNIEYLSALSMATMTHPEYGGRGIFSLLANDLYGKLESNPNFVSIWGFPNLNSHYGFIKNLGWDDISQVMHLSTPVSKISSNNYDFHITQSNSFNDFHENKMDIVVSSKKVSVIRSVKYLKWRYEDNPNNTYFIFNHMSECIEDSGFIVVKKYPDPNNANIFNLYVTEIGIQKHQEKLLYALLSYASNFFNQPEATINLWLSLFDNRYIIFEKLGFAPIGKSTYFSARSNHLHSSAIKDYRNWYLSYSDSDIY